MKRFVLVASIVAAFAATDVFAQSSQKGTSGSTTLGTVQVSKKVLADGKPLQPGTYQVRLTADEPSPGAGQTPGSERYVEFVRAGKVAGRELATVVSAEDIGKIAKGARPKPGGALVQTLKGGNYVRVWINKGGNNYIINLPTSA